MSKRTNSGGRKRRWRTPVDHPQVQDQVQDECRALPKWMLERAYDALCVMGTALSHHGFFVADRYSIADIALQGYTHVVEGGFDLKAYPAVLVWLDRIRSQLKHIAITQS